MTTPLVIHMPTRELLAGKTKNSFVYNLEHLNNENNVCKQKSSLSSEYNWNLRGRIRAKTYEDCRPCRSHVIQAFPWGQRLLHYGWQCKLKTFLYVNMVSLTTKPFTFWRAKIFPVSLGPSAYFMLHLLTDKTLLNSRVPILILLSYIFTWQKILLLQGAKF